MSVIALFECTVLRDLKKKGQLKMDENGYTEITLGAFDCLNSREEYYIFNNRIKQMFEPGGSVHRRLSRSCLRGELEHPSVLPGMTMEQYINRIRSISLTNVSHHIAKIRLEHGKDENGRNIVLAIGMVKPAGPHAQVLADSLANREENTCFSIRAMSRRFTENMRTNREITNVITYDHVNEPGISVATKYDTPSMECFNMDEMPFTEADLVAAEAYSDQLAESVSMESESELDFSMIRSSMGWEKIEVTKMKAFQWQ